MIEFLVLGVQEQPGIEVNMPVDIMFSVPVRNTSPQRPAQYGNQLIEHACHVYVEVHKNSRVVQVRQMFYYVTKSRMSESLWVTLCIKGRNLRNLDWA